MAGIHQSVGGHGAEHFLFPHAVEDPVAHIGLAGLDGMYAALRQMECHGPVVGDGVHHVLHPRVERRLGRPDVGTDHRDVLGHVPEDCGHKLRVFLVGSVVAQLPEALIVHGLPHQLVEERNLLAQPGAKRIQVVLSADDLGAGGLREGVQVHPVGRISKGVGRAGHGDGDPVVAEAHADVPHDETLLPIKGGVPLPLRHPDVGDAQGLIQAGVFHQLDRIIRPGVVSEAAGVAGLGPDGLPVVLVRDGVIKNALGSVHTCPPCPSSAQGRCRPWVFVYYTAYRSK